MSNVCNGEFELMDKQVREALGRWIPEELANDIVEDFLKMRKDLATATLERSAPGKFVETFVQILEFLDQGTYSSKPNVDEYLRKVQDRAACGTLSDGLRICGARYARAMYAIRNKRNILHKGEVDPNRFDLKVLFDSAQWIMAELVRNAAGTSMEQAGSLVAQIQSPVSSVVEDLGDRKLVLHDLSAKDEILVLLRDDYPEPVPKKPLACSMTGRHDSTIRKALKELRDSRLIVGNNLGYRLTRLGLNLADEIVSELAGSRRAA